MNPPEVIFGAGSLDQLAGVIHRCGAHRVLVIASARQASLVHRIERLLEGSMAGWDSRIAQHVPRDLAALVLAHSRTLGADLLVAVGGGSAIGMAKAVAVAGGPPILAIPTTYSGSEMTPIWGITGDGRKETGRDPRVSPRWVIYDPLLTVDFPLPLTGPSVFNAIAHCVEAMYAPDRGDEIEAFALSGFGLMLRSLLSLAAEPEDILARSNALQGSWAAGRALAGARMGLHHQLCHVLGGTYGLNHARCHAVLLPYVLGFNEPGAPAAVNALALVFSSEVGAETRGPQLASALRAFGRTLGSKLGIPFSLEELGFRNHWIDPLVQQVSSAPYPNPRPIEARDLRRLIQQAQDGTSIP